MKTTLLNLFYFPRYLLLCVVSFALVNSNTYAQSCKLNDIAMYGWMGDSDGHTASTNIDNSTTDDEDGDDWISFVNRGTSNVDISGWQLYTDQFYKRRSNSFATAAFTFPAGTVLSPGQKVFVIGQWDGGSIREGWYSANFNEGGEGLFEEVSNNDAWAILKNPGTNNYITVHQQGQSSSGMSLPSPASKVCNVNVTNFITNDFEGCEVILLNEATGAYYEQTNCSYASYPDSDGDGTPDLQDDDIDNDGIINSQDKFPNDTDNDGITNPGDTDKDGDGIPDSNEASGKILDTDNDGIPNKTDTDDDGDGLLDTVEIGVLNSDGKYTLPDSDGDGLPDLADPLDTDGDGIPDHNDLDDDNDGILDTVEGNSDADGDGIMNRLDLDSDNDGINDVIEAGGVDADGDGHPGNSPVTVDSNGVPTAAAGGLTPKNSDGDNVADYLDLDSDNDGINDIVESGNSAVIAADANKDGKIDFTSTAASDADGDGIVGAADGKPTWGDAAGTESAPADTDGDGVSDFRDLDSDNDGNTDVRENGSTDTDGNGQADGTDTDGDGIPATADGSPTVWGDSADPALVDTDGDGIPNNKDLDSDDDGINDVDEAGLTDTDRNGQADGADNDGDGIPATADGSPSTWGDASDPSMPAAVTTANGTPNTGPDTDGDGIKDSVDGAPTVWGDLGSATDLRPFIILQDANFVSSSLTKNLSVRVSNLTTATTTNPATPVIISISKTSDYSVVLTGNAGNNWTLENLDAFTIVLTSKSNLTVTNGTQAEITMAITALSTTSFGTTNIIVNIEDGSGGETNNLNNSVSRNLIRN